VNLFNASISPFLEGDDNGLIDIGGSSLAREDASSESDEEFGEGDGGSNARHKKRRARLLDSVDWSNLTVSQVELIRQRMLLLQYRDRLSLYEVFYVKSPLNEMLRFNPVLRAKESRFQ
jgi:hypothetical protein